MSDSIYVSIQLKITDRDRFVADYGRHMRTHNEAHGVEVLASDPAPRVIEGSSLPHQNVLLKFPSMDAFDAWYSAPEYQPLKAARIATTEHTNTVMVAIKSAGS